MCVVGLQGTILCNKMSPLTRNLGFTLYVDVFHCWWLQKKTNSGIKIHITVDFLTRKSASFFPIKCFWRHFFNRLADFECEFVKCNQKYDQLLFLGDPYTHNKVQFYWSFYYYSFLKLCILRCSQGEEKISDKLQTNFVNSIFKSSLCTLQTWGHYPCWLHLGYYYFISIWMGKVFEILGLKYQINSTININRTKVTFQFDFTIWLEVKHFNMYL